MKAIIIAITNSAAIPNAERFFPPAKLGNLKDPAKIQEKVNEHVQRLLSESAEHSLYGQPLEVSVTQVELPNEEQRTLTGPSGKTQIGDTQVFNLTTERDELNRLLCSLTDVSLLMGPHPTTHVRRLQNDFIRNQLPIPACFHRSVERLNVFQELCNASEGEYPDCLPPLGLRSTNPVDDTVLVARLLGIF